MSEQAEQIKALFERVEKLERQVALLLKRNSSTASPRRGDYRERYDTLDYPER